MTALALAKPDTGFKPRPYQQAAIDQTLLVLDQDPDARPLFVLPTGAGKGPLSAWIAERWIAERGGRVVISIHSKELVSQNYKKVREISPYLSCGIYSASAGRKDRNGQVTVASVQTIYRVAEQFRNVGLLIVDECHLIQHGESGMYHSLISGLRKVNPGLRIVGMTATPWRLGSGSLVEDHLGTPRLFTDISYEISIAELIAEGYLCPLVARKPETVFDVSGVKKRGGEFVESALDKAVNTDPLNAKIVRETLQLAADRKKIVVFAVSVDHARRLAELFQSAGQTAGHVHGGTISRERDRLLRDFDQGRLRIIVNVGVLTTGWDCPTVDCLVHARCTGSPGLYLQISGRGTRPVYAPGYDLDTREGRLDAIANGGKPDCLVLDFAGNVAVHGLIDNVRGVFKRQNKDEKKDDPKVRLCLECSSFNPPEAEKCDCCGAVFPKRGGPGVTAEEREAKLKDFNTATKIMSERADMWWSAVTAAKFDRIFIDNVPTLKLSYGVTDDKGQTVDQYGQIWASELFGFSSDGWRRANAVKTWRNRAKTLPPASVDEAVARILELPLPKRVRLRRNDRGYLVVVSAEF